MRTVLAILILLSPSLVSAQWYGRFEAISAWRSFSGSSNVQQRNQTEVLDTMGVGTGSFVVGSTTTLKIPDLEAAITGRAKVGYWDGELRPRVQLH
ncbi:MAG: hypothetical protein H8E66_34825 [Planctomycetes bacterium]|nr:hypothetical protein [Planctomycetota bacterium]